MKKYIYGILGLALALNSCSEETHDHSHHSDGDASYTEGSHDHYSGASMKSQMHYPEEKHLANIKQLTYGGDNAEAYWSSDNNMLVFQANNPKWGTSCDQIYVMSLNENLAEGKQLDEISTGRGRTTCAYFMQGDSTILYGSTHLEHVECPPAPVRGETEHYVWPIYPEYDIFVSDLEGNITTQLTSEPGYDAEATVSPDGEKIVFTSMRTGDLELFVMDKDGSNVVQVTDHLGYDGGAFFSPDGTKLVYRTSSPKTEEEIKLYKDLLAQDLVQPTEMEIHVCNIDGSNDVQVTNLGGANWAPFYHPSGDKILFSSNHRNSEKGIPFNLFMVNEDGSGLEQVTYDSMFDSFPMFSPDGKKLVWGSNRNNGGGHATNLFVADWVE